MSVAFEVWTEMFIRLELCAQFQDGLLFCRSFSSREDFGGSSGSSVPGSGRCQQQHQATPQPACCNAQFRRVILLEFVHAPREKLAFSSSEVAPAWIFILPFPVVRKDHSLDEAHSSAA